MVRNLKSFDVPVLNYVGNESRQEPFHISEEVWLLLPPVIYMNSCVSLFLILCLLVQMSALGIHSRLDQVFDAPTAVKEVLTSQFGLDRSVCFPSFLLSSLFLEGHTTLIIKLNIWEFGQVFHFR